MGFWEEKNIEDARPDPVRDFSFPCVDREATATTAQRQQATRYDVLCALDEAMIDEFRALEDRVQLLERMFAAWHEVPAFERAKLGYAGHSNAMHQELIDARQKLWNARTWNWTRRIAGYSSNKIVIAHA